MPYPNAVEELFQQAVKDQLDYSAGVFTTFADSTAGSSGRGANPFGNSEASPSVGQVGGDTNNNINIRGLTVPFQNREGFRFGLTVAEYNITLGALVDTVNVARTEVVRGPGALLYGIGVLSGIANVIPQRPSSEWGAIVSAGVGNEDFRRVSLDVYGALVQKGEGVLAKLGDLNFRFATAQQEEGDWTDFYYREKEYYVGQLEWKPFENINILFEYEYGDLFITGNGPMAVYDGLENAQITVFRNKYGEQMDWAMDIVPGFDYVQFGPNPNDAYYERRSQGVPHSYRVTGPDTYYDREEWAFMPLMDWRISDSLSARIGGYITHQQDEVFDVELDIRTNLENELNYDQEKLNYSSSPPIPDGFDLFVTNPDPLFFEPTRAYPDDVKFMRYWWTKRPRHADSKQFKAALTYVFETPFIFSEVAEHTLLAGRHDIADRISFYLGTEGPEQPEELLDATTSYRNIPFTQWGDLDAPYKLGNVFATNAEPIRYQGEQLATPGGQYLDARQWFTGHYLTYQGRFFDDTLRIITGLRHDRYQAWEGRWLNESAALGLSNRTADNLFFGYDTNTTGYAFEDDIEEVTRQFGVSWSTWGDRLSFFGVYAEGISPNTGQRDGAGNFIEAEQTSSTEFGVKYEFFGGRLSGEMTIYQIERENASWRWVNAPQPSTDSKQGVLWRSAGSPVTALDEVALANGTQILGYGINERYFDDDEFLDVLGFDRTVLEGGRGAASYLQQLNGNDFRFGDPGSIVGPLPGNEGVAVRVTRIPFNERQVQGLTDDEQYVIYLDYRAITALPEDDPRRVAIINALDAAMADWRNPANHPDYEPIHYGAASWEGGDVINASSQRVEKSGNTASHVVTFEDEIRGFEVRFILSPTDNWQIRAGYAHTESEAQSNFKLVDFSVGGQNVATPYDIWVRDLGTEAFADPSRPSTTQATGGISGQSLFRGSEDTANLFTKYSFSEGFLDGLSLTLGTIWRGQQPTAIPIGGANLSANRFPTPDTEDFFRVDFGVIFTRRFDWFDMRVALNVYNLLDDDELESFVSYTDNEGLPVHRRWVTRQDPRTYKITTTFTF